MVRDQGGRRGKAFAKGDAVINPFQTLMGWLKELDLAHLGAALHSRYSSAEP